MWKLWPVSLVFLLAGCASQREAASPYHTPPGFTVESAASPALADSFVAFTFDSLGRPVVSTEAGHPSTLYDTDHDGIYDSSKPFTDRVSNARGLWFDGRTLYLIGEDDNHQSGLWRAEDTNGDDVADKVELIAAFHPAANEPGPYAIRRAPDGEPTFLLADAAALPPDSIDAASPFQGGRTALDSEGGALVRFNREQRNFSLLLGGLHNVSGQAYNLDGEAFTVDGDAEADADLPGSSPARIVHAVPGADYGWRAGAATLPGYYLDTLPPVQDLGRAAPVALDVYQHHVYPDPYRGALFEADAHGRIVSTPIVLNGATYRAANPEPAEFVQADSLPVTALETGPDGFLYFTTAGAKGNLFRVRYTAGFVETHLSSAEPTGVTAVVRQPQPLSSWGWAAVEKAKADLGSDWQASLTALVQDANAAPEDRIQALLTLERHGPQPRSDLLIALARDRERDLRAAVIYVAGLHHGDRPRNLAIAALADADPLVRRRAAEALIRMGLSADQPGFAQIDAIYPLLSDPDRFVRYAGRLALERTPRHKWKDRALNENDRLAAAEALLALVQTASRPGALRPILDRTLNLLGKPGLDSDDQLRLLRVLDLAATGAGAAVSADMRDNLSALLLPHFPASDERLNRELARALAYAGRPEAIAKILAAMPKGGDNQPLQIHYVYCLRAIPEGWTPAQKQQLIDWFDRAATWHTSDPYRAYLHTLFEATAPLFTPEEKELAYKNGLYSPK